jgi:pyruvate ferredoxin oxidoreductase alpha subunit
MTVANRAIGAPINIWNDHTDTMALRDCGWIQLFAETNQEAVDLHLQAFRLAEELSVPVMVCMDGFILTHAVERVDIPSQEQVDAWLPPYEPRQVLDPADPVSIGAMVGPEAFMEVRYLAHVKQRQALDLIPAWAREFEQVFGRKAGGLVRSYRCEDADMVVVSMGSVLGTLKDTVDQLREEGMKVGVLGIHCFRPWPAAAIREALGSAKRVLVVEKSLAVGLGGVVAANVAGAYHGHDANVHTVIAGLGGRAITRASLRKLLEAGMAGELERITFLDLDQEMVDRALERERSTRRSGPIAEALLRDIGVVAARPA